MAIPKRLHQIGLAALLFLGFLCQAQAAVVGWGGRDVTFTPPALNGPVNVIIQLKVGANAGKYLIGGSFTDAGGNTAIDYVARLNANGTIDTGFTPPTFSAGTTSCALGDGTNSPTIDVRTLLETQTTSGSNNAGKIYIGGNFTSAGGVTKADYLIRVNANGGSPNNTFWPTNTGASTGTVSYTNCVRTIFTGERSGSTMALVVGSAANGRLTKKVYDTGADYAGFTTPNLNAAVNSGFYCPAGTCGADRYIVGGNFTDAGGFTGMTRLAKITTTGGVYTGGGYPTSDGTTSGTVLFNQRVNSIALDTSTSPASILVGGAFTGKLKKLGATTFLQDAGYTAPVSGAGSTLDGPVWSVAVDTNAPNNPGGGTPSYLFAGGFTNAGDVPQCDYVCSSTETGTVTWYFPAPPPTAVVRVATVNTYADTNVGKYMIGGSFTDLGGNTATDYIARLNQATPSTITMNSSGGNTAGTDGIRTVYSNGQWQVYRGGTGQLYFPDDPPPYRYQYNQIALALTDGSGGGYIIGPSTLSLSAQYWDTSNRVFRPWDSVTATGGSTGTGTGASDLSVQVDGRTYVVHLALDYTYPNDYITQTFTVTIPAGNTYNVKLYNLYDSYLGGSDNGPGFYNASSKIVGVSGQTVYEGLRYVSGQAWAGYMSSEYTDVVFGDNTFSDHVGPGTGTNLDNTIIADPATDNGFGINWDFGSTSGSTTVADDFIFSDFVAPTAAATANPGEIKVDWTDPAGITPAPDSYVVTAYDGSFPTGHTCTVSAPTRTCTFTLLNPAIAYTFLVDFRSGGSSVFNAGSNNDATPLPYQLTGTLWRDNGAGGGGKENGLKAGAETLLNLPGTVLGGQAGYVVILDNINTVVAIAAVCVNATPSPCVLGQSPGDWQATTIAAEPYFIAYVTDEANKPNLGDTIALSPSPAVAPTGFGFTIPNANNSSIEGAVPNGILTGINPATAFTLNFGVVSSSCAIP